MKSQKTKIQAVVFGGQKENERLVAKTKELYRQLRQRAYECLEFLVSIDEITDMFVEDNTTMLREMRDDIAKHKGEFVDCGAETIKLRKVS